MSDFETLVGLTVPVQCNRHAAAEALQKLAATVDRIQAAAKQTEPEPTEAQKESGRYRKGRVSWKGLTLAIETAAGNKRRPEWPALKDHYGYVEGTESGADDDAVDVFISEEHPDSELVFVVNQKKEDGTFDEHKCVLGCISLDQAKKTYLRNYSPGWTGMGEVSALTLSQFKWWLENADTSKEVKNGYFAAVENRKPMKKAAADPVTGTPAELPYRERAELYALKDGKLFGSLYPHGGFGVYGGGIDPGEDAATAAAREFGEEAGYNVTNVRALPFEPHALDWKPPFDNPKLAERAKQFRGSRTHYFVGDLGDQIPGAKVDELGRRDPRLYGLDEALKLADLPAAHAEGPGVVAANKKRLEILKHLREITTPKLTQTVDREPGDIDLDRIDAHLNGKNVGYLTSHPGSDGDYRWIKGMKVDPAYRRRGIAKQMMRQALSLYGDRELRLRAKPYDDEPVTVDQLKAFYSQFGFEPLDDENRMRRPVTPKQADDLAAFWKENEARKAEVEADPKAMPHVREGYILCDGCGYRYHVMPPDDVCPKCDHTIRTRLRGISKKAFEEYVPVLTFVKRADDADHPFTIAVDFDGTLAESQVPFDPETCGEPREKALAWVRLFHENGARIIIFTVRGNTKPVEAWLTKHDVPYDFINENPDQPPGSSGKVYADAYWDDRAYNAVDPDEHGPAILHKLLGTAEGEPEGDDSSPAITIRRETVVTITGPSLLAAMEGTDDDEGPGED